jgi:uncharacterized protein
MSSNSFSKIVALSIVALVIAVAFLGFTAYSANRPAQADAGTIVTTATQTTPSTISVAGLGTVNVIPDEVQVTLGYMNSGPNATLVLMNNSAIMDAVTQEIENNVGVNSTDIQTTQFNFNPTYAQYSNTINGYQASNFIQISLQGSATSKLDSVINAAVNAGVNDIQTISYTISNTLQSQLKRQAMQAAVADANSTALGLAASESVKILGIQNVIVVNQAYPPMYYNTFGSAADLMASVNYAVPISPGQSQFTIQVEVTYLIS